MCLCRSADMMPRGVSSLSSLPFTPLCMQRPDLHLTSASEGLNRSISCCLYAGISDRCSGAARGLRSPLSESCLFSCLTVWIFHILSVILWFFFFGPRLHKTATFAADPCTHGYTRRCAHANDSCRKTNGSDTVQFLKSAPASTGEHAGMMWGFCCCHHFLCSIFLRSFLC